MKIAFIIDNFPKSSKVIALYACSLFSIFAVALLFYMPILPWPVSFVFPGIEVLSGQVEISQKLLLEFNANFRAIIIFDYIFIFCWMISWVGFSFLIVKKSRWLGFLFLILGISASLFDFVENGILLKMLENFSLNKKNVSLLPFLNVVQKLSYILPFVSVMLVSVVFWFNSKIKSLLALSGFTISLIASISLFFPGFFFLRYAWFVLWFIFSSILLWRSARNL